MRVLHVISDSNWGGAGGYLISLLSHLQESDCESLVACPSNSQLLAPLAALDVETSSYGPGERSWHISDALSIRQLLRRLRPQLVHTHASLSARCAARYHRLPTIYTKHGLSSPRGARSAAWGQRLLPAGVIAVSGAVRDQLVEHGIASADIKVIYNGVNVADVHVCPQEQQHWRGQLQKTPGPLFAFMGRLAWEKGPDVLLQAAALVVRDCPQAQFVFLGEGPMRSELSKTIADANLGDHVTLVGFVSNVAPVLAACDLLVQASRSEGFPLAILEAMALGVPVIATAVGGVPELVLDGLTGRLVPSEQPVALANAILSAWKDSVWRQQVAKRARQRVEQEFSAQLMAERTLAFYHEHLGVMSHG